MAVADKMDEEKLEILSDDSVGRAHVMSEVSCNMSPYDDGRFGTATKQDINRVRWSSMLYSKRADRNSAIAYHNPAHDI